MPFLISPVLTAGTLTRRPQPALPADGGLLLRPWRAGDAPAVYEVFQDPLMHQWHARAADSVDEVGDWIREWHQAWDDEREAHWAVADVDSGALLGRVALRELRLYDGTAEVAYWTAPAARGRVSPVGPRPRSPTGPSTRPASTGWNSCTPCATRPRAASPPERASPWRAPSAGRPSSRTDGTTCTCTRGSAPAHACPREHVRRRPQAADTLSCSASIRAFHSRLDSCQPSSLWPRRQ